jgi:hypothetical protein
MSNSTIRLIEAVRARTTTRSDYAVAKALGISTQRVCMYMKRQRGLDDDATITRAANLIGEDPAALLAEFQAERANSPEAAGHWRRLAELARQYGGSAAVLLLALGVTVSPALHSAPPSQRLTAAMAPGYTL